MNKNIESVFTQAEGRYLNSEELQTLTAYTNSLPQRIEAMKALEQAEGNILNNTLQEVWRKHPEFDRMHAYAKDKCYRDVGLVLRYASFAMLRDEPDYLSDKLLYWMRTIIQSFEFGAVIDTTYTALLQQAKAQLEPKAFQLLSPHLVTAHKILTMKQD